MQKFETEKIVAVTFCLSIFIPFRNYANFLYEIKLFLYYLRMSIFFCAFVILSTMINFQLLREALLQVKGGLVALAVAIYLVNIAIRAYRLQVLLNKDSKRITLKDAYLITLIGAALNMVIPATMGDIGRSYYGYKMYGIKEEMLSATLLDKIFALNSLFLLGFFSAFLMGYFCLAWRLCLP